MSAYSASAPVTASTTAPSRTNAAHPLCIMNVMAYIGLTAARMAGERMTSCRPVAAITVNQINISGPKNAPTFAVPWRCIKNSPKITTMVTGIMTLSKFGDTISSPSMAPSTEIAGVITPSP